jgi:hypothetical protein
MEMEACMRICIRIRTMCLMLDSAYAYAYGRLYIYGPETEAHDAGTHAT